MTPDDELVTARKRTPLAVSIPFTSAPAEASEILNEADASAMQETLARCNRHAHARAKRHLLVFGLCVATLISLVGSAARFPPEAAPFVVLGSAVCTWLGTTMLYVGFVYGHWEVNALLNVIEELELYRKSIEAAATAGGHEILGQ